MSPENQSRLKQAFPSLFENPRLECTDTWFAQLMSLGAKLDACLEELALADRSQYQIDSVVETGTGLLDVTLKQTNERLDALLAEFETSSVRNLESPDAHPYLWTHNTAEQTHAEETLRADKSNHSPTELQESTVRSAEAVRKHDEKTDQKSA